MDLPLRRLQWQKCFPVFISWHWDTAQSSIRLTDPQAVPDSWGWDAPAPRLPQPLPLTEVMAPAKNPTSYYTLQVLQNW